MDMAGAASARAVKRIEAVRDLRAVQFPEDAGSMAHPVRPDSYVEINNFYTPTIYEKGAEVVRMMHTLVGREGFRRGMDLYFQRHDGQAVTCDDFAQAIADANPGSELAPRLDAFKRWYSQAGTPRLVARGQYEADQRRYTLTLQQSGGRDALPFVIPVLAGLLRPDGSAIGLRLEGEATEAAAERLLVLQDAVASWTFVDVDAEPVPSLLRGFSAPVRLDSGLGDEALLVRLAHDSDPFNRWEAGQRLALNRVLAALAHETPPPLDDAFIAAMRGVLRHPDLDPAFKDLALRLPDEAYIAEQVESVDPQRIHLVRETFRNELAARLHKDWAWAFETHQVREGYRPGNPQAGRRALANLALGMLCRHAVQTGDAAWPGRAYQRLKDAAHMTDRLGALSALVGSNAELAAPALAHFHALFRHDALVIDKWFALQAGAPEPLGAQAGQTFTRARALLQHPDFSLRNPNRARSLLLTLFSDNPAAFHRPDAAGYVLWAEKLLEVDAFNPQLASRLARVMSRWSHLAEPCRSAAREAIHRVAARPDLSDDVREIVSRALEQA